MLEESFIPAFLLYLPRSLTDSPSRHQRYLYTVVVFHEVKLKQTLGSKTIGSHVAIVSGFDEKKVKLRVLEVDKNGSSVDEGSYKLDDLKQGTITIYRVLGRDFLQ